ncbi:competence protein ComGB [Pelagirhabdus alkalitolerans]|uniref:Competence protein ComGB n=2 Tax=Pelagirhabdus alkalitolerans TaxID=1612202 RepID=A0A1G6HYW5_9BACI|nr:competence protein ComGB [Pelagirhabdus alkalitolerans]
MVFLIKPFLKPKPPLTLTIDHQLRFLDRLSHLFEQGYVMFDALHLLKSQSFYREICDYIKDELNKGQTFDHCLKNLGFNPHIITYIHFSLKNGHLHQAIQEATQYIKKRRELQHQFFNTIRYPLILITMFLIILLFINWFVYPAFEQLYSTHYNSSTILHLAIVTTQSLFNILLTLSILCSILITIMIQVNKQIKLERIHNILQHFRFIKKWISLYVSFHFAIHLSSLLDAHFSLKSSLTFISHHQEKTLVNFYATRLLNDLERGETTNEALQRINFFEKEFISLFERQSDHLHLKKDLEMYASFTLSDLQERCQLLIRRIQPIVFSIIACSIILIYLSILIPMLQLIQTI